MIDSEGISDDVPTLQDTSIVGTRLSCLVHTTADQLQLRAVGSGSGQATLPCPKLTADLQETSWALPGAALSDWKLPGALVTFAQEKSQTGNSGNQEWGEEGMAKASSGRSSLSNGPARPRPPGVQEDPGKARLRPAPCHNCAAPSSCSGPTSY